MTDNVYIDYLTGVYNRKWLYEQFVLNMKSEGCSVLYMDLDNFKSVNDLYGHVEGDRVLKYFADSVRSVERDGFPVRMSGDEFVLILDKPVSAEGITEIYNRLTQKVKEGIREVPSLSFITVSAGAHTSRDGTELQEILDDADAAMYQSKRDGKNRCVFFEDIRQKIIMEKTIADEAPKALKEGRFDILFDPAINLQSSLPEQTRVAVVQKNLDGGLSDSESFRYVLEENGFIRTLDLSLLRRLFKAVSGMERDVFEKSVSESRNIRFSFEVSELLIIDKTFFDTLKGLLAKYHIDPAIIDISVSEKAFAGRDVELLISGMERISGIGITMTIKNFGDNFASIRYLTMIPVSTIRLDPGWLRKSLTDKRERKILKSVIRLVKDMHLTVIAMGDIDKEGIDYLKGYGCDAVGKQIASEYLTSAEYFGFIKERVPDTDGITFEFEGNLKDSSGKYEGMIVGEGITFEKGISDLHGGLHFNGGDIGENLVSLPESLFSSDSYTIALWIKPQKKNNWCSAVYMRYQGGFTSLVPYSNAENGISIFRISIDNEDFYDTTCRAVRQGDWSHLCVAYDASNETVRYFINGRKARAAVGMPVQIGCRKVLLGGDPFQRSFEGSMSSIRVYDYAITDEAVKQLYDSYLQEPGYSGTVEEYWMDTE